MIALACFIIFPLSFVSIGQCLTRKIFKKISGKSFLGDSVICSFSSGLVFFSYYWYIMAQFHFLAFPAVGIYLAISVAAMISQYSYLKNSALGFTESLRAIWNKCHIHKILITAIFIAMSSTLLRCWGSYIEGDSLVYHLYLPKQFVLHGGFWQVPYSEHLYWPLFSEMAFVPGEIIKSLALSKMITFCVYAAFCLLAGLFVRRKTESVGASLIAISAIALCPAFFFHAPSTYNDLYFSFYLLFSLYIFMRLKSRSAIFLAGIFAGSALATKFTALYGLIAFAPIILYQLLTIKPRSCVIRSFVLFAGGTAIAAAPYYLRSWLHYGNPVFPFAQKIFNTPFGYGLTEAGLVGSNVSGFNGGTGRGLLDFLLLVWNMTFSPGLFGGDKIGFLIIALFPFILFAAKKNGGLTVYCVLYTLVWFFLSQYNRYLLPVLALIAIIGSVGLDSVSQRFAAFKRPLFIFLTLLIAIHTPWPVYHCYKDFFIRKPESIIPIANWLNVLIKNPQEKVLTVEDERLYYYNFAAFRESTFRNFTLYPNNPNPKNTVDLLDKENVRYLLIANPRAKQLTGFDPISYFENLVQAGYYELLESQSSPEGVPYSLYQRTDAKL